MRLFSVFQRKSGGPARTPPAVDTSPDAVQQARTRARRRLIGAAVLVVIGVIGFPLLFETQPRPIPVDIPIEIPRKDGVPPLVMPNAKPPKAPQVVQAPAEPAASATSDVTTETASDAGREIVPPAAPTAPVPATKPAASRPASSATSRAAAEPAAPAPAKPTQQASARPASAAPGADARRAQALLDGQKEAPGRFVVQVGAFADPSAARDTRQKVEKLGLKTYTQVAETSNGSRIRVRVGPFASRDEAERAQARLKAAGSNAVVLTL